MYNCSGASDVFDIPSVSAVLSTLHLHAMSVCLIPGNTWVSTILSQIVAIEIKA